MTILPPEERLTSPVTGWTRSHWEWAADRLLDGVAPFASASGAAYDLPFGRPSHHGARADRLEGFARTFLLAAFRSASPGAPPHPALDRYAAGLAAGVDPRCADAWPEAERHGQQVVEAASVAVAIWASRDVLWAELDSRTKDHVIAWLGRFSVDQCWSNNWVLFPVVIHAVLRALGAPHRSDEIDAGLDAVDAMALGSGWYADGRSKRVDHYNGWAFAHYTGLWCLIDGDRNAPDRAAVIRGRIRAFLAEYQLLFDREGGHLLYGRSLVYRCAGVSSFLIGDLLDAGPLAPGAVRRLASGSLKQMHRQTPLDAGPLPLGLTREFLPAGQRYSSPASPYWVAKAFVGLIAPKDAPLWSATEEQIRADGPDFTTALRGPGMVVAATDGVVRAAGHASRALGGRQPSESPAYRKLCYSTRTAPNYDNTDVDAQLRYRGRARRQFVGIEADSVSVIDEYTGARVETVTIVTPTFDLRVHVVQGRRGGRVTSGGFALADDAPLHADVDGMVASVRRPDGLVSAMRGLHGFERAHVVTAQSTNPLGLHSATPVLAVRRKTGGRAPQVLVAMCLLATAESVVRLLASPPTTEVGADRIVVTWPDGTQRTLRLKPPTGRRRRGVAAGRPND